GRRFGEEFPWQWQLVSWQLNPILKKLGLADPVVACVTPQERFLLSRIPHRSSLYIVGDEVVMPGESELTEAVDMILAISPLAFEEHRAIHPHKTVRFSTGVACERFVRTAERTAIPQDMCKLRRPLIGYSGSVLRSRLDLDLIRFLSQRHP